MDDSPPEPVELPIDGVLDLHGIKPSEIKEVLPEYLRLCRQRGIFEVRIVHGKGIGNLRRTVHALLAQIPDVLSFNLARPEFGGWGATIAYLQRGDKPPQQAVEK